tara:strand:+ start:959 stop:1333 length:375 start_codon:yes stop_codon:yes gene_type:complete
MKIRINRDSVCAGDDVISHNIEWNLKESMTLSEFLDIQNEIYPLARIAGGRATWILKGQDILAVLAQQWAKPKFVANESTLIKENLNVSDKYRGELHFHYWVQTDPIKVYEEIINTGDLPKNRY